VVFPEPEAPTTEIIGGILFSVDIIKRFLCVYIY